MLCVYRVAFLLNGSAQVTCKQISLHPSPPISLSLLVSISLSQHLSVSPV
uniref:Uncharacterized protein n=1 Tax=Rhizophora mucronata TaxID=61149 RepID=A0A2P2QYW0_RHIMU